MLSPLVLSTIRTVVPAAVGATAAWLLATFGLAVPDELLVEAVTAGTLIATTLYYVAARWVERRYPSWSWLLGTGAQPATYVDAAGRATTDTRTPTAPQLEG